MKKKLNFVISLILTLVISLSAFILPASSFKNDEITSSKAMILINLDTKTIVFTQKTEKKWYATYQSELMTFLLMTQKVKDPQSVAITVDEEFIGDLEYTDGCLDAYLGETLTLKDIAAIMMLTSGSDAAYLIADYVSGGDIEAFVEMMNQQAAVYKCKNTHFTSPGYSESDEHLTTCSDLARIYSRLVNNELFSDIMSSPTYIPGKYGDDDDYAVTTENSIMNPVSPYYFRYVTGGKYAFVSDRGASIAVTTSYKDMRYMFIALNGKNEAEENVFTDARRLTTWAYLNLSDRKVIDTDVSVSKTAVKSTWGVYDIDLYADNSARKTLPNEYEQNKFSVKMDVPKTLDLPLFQGEAVGSAVIRYDGEKLDTVSIVPNHDEGVSMLSDISRFGGYALAKMFPNAVDKYVDDEKGTEPPTEAPTKAAKKAKIKATEAASDNASETTAATEAQTDTER